MKVDKREHLKIYYEGLQAMRLIGKGKRNAFNPTQQM
jgi:hypothetical protein